MSSPARDYPLSRSRIETETYSPMIVDDLLSGLNEWRSVQDIIRLTFKALSDVVKSQGGSIKDLELQMPSKASKAELNSGLAMKANISDISRTFSELRSSLDSKATIDDVYPLVEDKVSRSDLQYLLGNKVSYEELRTALEAKADLREIQSEVRALRAAMEEMHEETYRKLQQCANVRDIQNIEKQLEIKANISDVNEALQEKANKESVANALHRKANRVDIDALLSKKAELIELKNLERVVDTKADISNFDLLAREVELKGDRAEITKYITYELSKKAEKTDIDGVLGSLNSSKKDTESKTSQKFLEVEQYLSNLKVEYDKMQASISAALARKSDVRDFEKLSQLVGKKSDSENVGAALGSLKAEVLDLINGLQSQLKYESRRIEEYFTDKTEKLGMNGKILEEEIGKVKAISQTSSSQGKADLDESMKYVQNVLASIKNEDIKVLRHEIAAVQRDVEELHARKSDKAETLKYLESKADIKQLQESLDKLYKESIREIRDNKDEVTNLILRKERDLAASIDKKASLGDVNSFVYEKSENLLQKIKSEDLESLKTYSRSQGIDLDSKIRDLQKVIDHISKEFVARSNIKEIYSLLDLKANSDEVNKIIQGIHRELDLKAANDDLNVHINEQSILNELLCAENCVARWIWKSGDLRAGNSIPWEIQSVNTCPDNFLWEKEKTSVLTIAPGLYEVIYGFFSRVRPIVQLLVNGQPVLTECQNEGKIWGRHPDGNIIGYTIKDFIALPARARISIVYSGDLEVEGFLGLRKL
ncbi:unnamed protein product [Blepharisma stoltei]|uniref:Uncharacterized protein n=1 Tax=Blepharisma stoltei TaxID=1481888 RepID=A0AAU9IN29_9CILI|nr:unnamed protein product [Blepharisma stoltei]